MCITDDELCNMLQDLDKPNTKKADKKCDKAFTLYLSTLNGLDSLDYWLFNPKELDKILCKFWFKVQTCEGKPCRVSTLKHMRYGINRNRKRKGHECDIIKSPQFKKSWQKFIKACSLLKAKGYGFIEHHTEIKPKGNLIPHISCI